MSAALVDVTFIDADTGQTFLQLKVPARQLPERFDAATTLNLGKDDWHVIEATPAESSAFIASGKLTLRLKRLDAIDVRDILFSVPTVADEVPKALPGSGALLKLHEDDWLQHELVPVELEAALAHDLDAIRKVLDTERQGPGFKRLHIRKAVPAPFAQRVLPLATLEQRFGAPRTVAWSNAPGLVEHGFAFVLPDGATLYGVAHGPRVAQLGIDRRDAGLEGLCADERLVLVDWCRAETISTPR